MTTRGLRVTGSTRCEPEHVELNTMAKYIFKDMLLRKSGSEELVQVASIVLDPIGGKAVKDCLGQALPAPDRT